MDDLDEQPVLSTWTIYSSPADAPGMFVVRRWDIYPGSDPVPAEDATQHLTVRRAREAIPPGLHRLDRQANDDPTIIETWV